MTVDVFADIACPFCYIGERHFEQALAEAGREVTWRWRPFQLQPNLPKEGVPWEAFAEEKFGGSERAQAAFRHVAQMGAAAGLDFRFDRLSHAVNTIDAHRLVLWAAEQDRAQELAQALFAAYFTEGRHVGDAEELARLTGETELDVQEARAVLASDRFEGAVEESQQEARRLGVTGVPFYIFRDGPDDARAVSGAQPVEVFRRALAGDGVQTG